MIMRACILWCILTLTCAMSGCSSGGSEGDGDLADLSDEQLSSKAIEHLRECKVVGAGTFQVGEVEDAFARCTLECVIETSCANLQEELCSGGRLDPNGAYLKCTEACYDSTVASQFMCSDGSRVPHRQVCDLQEDCADGEDEAQSCPEHVCADGEVLLAKSVRCNGVSDCEDGSDEDGCATFCK
jgi:hypothetical protein